MSEIPHKLPDGIVLARSSLPNNLPGRIVCVGQVLPAPTICLVGLFVLVRILLLLVTTVHAVLGFSHVLSLPLLVPAQYTWRGG